MRIFNNEMNMRSKYNKKVLFGIAILGAISLVFLFSIGYSHTVSSPASAQNNEGFLLPDIQFIKYSIDRLGEIFKLF